MVNALKALLIHDNIKTILKKNKYKNGPHHPKTQNNTEFFLL